MARSVSRLAESWTYVLASDQTLKAEEQTVFRLSPMTQAERVAAYDDASRVIIQGDGTQVVAGRERQVALALCLSHIEDVQNFPVGAPKPWPIGTEERARYLEQLHDTDIAELGGEIYDRSTIGRTEKNS
jgi:hypothetical protein